MNSSARSPSRRHLARQALIQALYQWQLNPESCTDILEQFVTDPERLGQADSGFFQRVWTSLCPRMTALDGDIAVLLSERRWDDEVSPVERAILRLAAWELRHQPETPYRVVLNEAIELGKGFGAEQGHRFVNGVLDRLAAQWRPVEYQPRHQIPSSDG